VSTHLRDLVHHSLVGGLLEEHLVEDLVPRLVLRPLLLLTLTTSHGGSHLLLLGLLLHLGRLFATNYRGNNWKTVLSAYLCSRLLKQSKLPKLL
jgi:hypothetical protein